MLKITILTILLTSAHSLSVGKILIRELLSLSSRKNDQNFTNAVLGTIKLLDEAKYDQETALQILVWYNQRIISPDDLLPMIWANFLESYDSKEIFGNKNSEVATNEPTTTAQNTMFSTRMSSIPVNNNILENKSEESSERDDTTIEIKSDNQLNSMFPNFARAHITSDSPNIPLYTSTILDEPVEEWSDIEADDSDVLVSQKQGMIEFNDYYDTAYTEYFTNVYDDKSVTKKLSKDRDIEHHAPEIKTKSLEFLLNKNHLSDEDREDLLTKYKRISKKLTKEFQRMVDGENRNVKRQQRQSNRG